MSDIIINYKKVIELFNSISDDLCTRNSDINSKLDQIVEIIVSNNMFTKIHSSKQSEVSFYRARKYNESDKYDRYRNQSKNMSPFKGYDSDQSFVNRTGKNVQAGRCNPENISYLYMSSSEEGCIKEVCPSLRDIVSVAKIIAKEDLNLIKLDYKVTAGYNSNDFIEGVDNCWVLSDLPEFFSRKHETDKDYRFSQYVTQYIKNKGFDGIVYDSSQKGDTEEEIKNSLKYKNYVIFNYEKCEPISSNLYAIKNIKYEYE